MPGKSARKAANPRDPWPPSKQRLQSLVAEAVVDACCEFEQRMGFLTMIEEHLLLPFETQLLGVACRRRIRHLGIDILRACAG